MPAATESGGTSTSLRIARRAFPTDRNIHVASAALAAPQGTVQARAAQALEYCRVNLDGTAAAAARYARDLATLGHGAKG
jgi:hypothetical protein